MKNKNLRGILALTVVTVLSFGVILGSRALTENPGEESAPDEVEITEELDVNGMEQIVQAGKTKKGYLVTVKTKGYGGDILMDVFFDSDGKTITGTQIKKQNETENLGAKIAEPEFLDQFQGAKAPVYLPGMSLDTDEEKAGENELAGAVLQDGRYEAETDEPDSSGFRDQVFMNITDGKITEVTWESVGEDGSKKSVLSENGEYVMTEEGLTWKEQAEALAKALIENQSLEFLHMDEQGKTDAVSGVSISVGGFVSLAETCMREAAGMEIQDSASLEEAVRNGTEVDAVSGATVSSTAVVTGINRACEFLQSVLQGTEDLSL